MNKTNKKPAAKSPPAKVAPAGKARNQNPPTEPLEVLGRHKNSGQKDHKGAR